mmetsp:Transcript_9569/g.24365  ORF Transcript_9569/g.24365 Transcript_9569/m.24365 type:complete len:128 (-) Transcript_9569:106-489(-)
MLWTARAWWAIVVMATAGRALSLIPRRDAILRLAALPLGVPAANAVVPGGEFCICRPDGECFGQNCGGLKAAENPKATTIAQAKTTYNDELRDAVEALKKKKEADDDTSSVDSSLSSSSSGGADSPL